MVKFIRDEKQSNKEEYESRIVMNAGLFNVINMLKADGDIILSIRVPRKLPVR